MSVESITPTAEATVARRAELDRIWQGLASLRPESAAAVVPEHMPGHLTFGIRGNSGPYLLWGWSRDEDDSTWTVDREVFLGLTRLARNTSYFLNVRLDPLLTQQLECQRVQVCLGETPVALWQVNTPGHYFALLPSSLLTAQPLHLVLRLPDAISPKSLGQGDDERLLGVKVHELWLTPWINVSF